MNKQKEDFLDLKRETSNLKSQNTKYIGKFSPLLFSFNLIFIYYLIKFIFLKL